MKDSYDEKEIKLAVYGAAGRMGFAIIDRINHTANCSLGAAIDQDNNPMLGRSVIGNDNVKFTNYNDANLSNCDAIICFTSAEGLDDVIAATKKSTLPLVVGTTGYSIEQKNNLLELEKDVPILIEPNMSIGVNAMCQVLKLLAKELSNWDAEILEIHHSGKKDSPSGTAKLFASTIHRASHSRSDIVTDRKQPRKAGEVGVTALRAGDIAGVHTALFVGPGESIEITHRAFDRSNFASGAVFAAMGLVGKQPGRYTLEQLIKAAQSY